jgi:hypothetical protein
MTTTGIPTGLGATVGFAAESPVGTFTAPGRWFQFDKEALKLKKKPLQGQGINGGLYERSKRRTYAAREVSGTFAMDLADRGLGLILSHMIGSTPNLAAVSPGGTVLQTHTPGMLVGKSLSAQVGRPSTDGTVNAFSYNGLKIADWEIACAAEAIAKLTLTLDGWDESTSQTYTAPSTIAANQLTFAGGQVMLGGTPTTTGGIVTVGGTPTTLAVVKQASVKCQNVLDTARFFLGSSVKKEQLDNGFRKLTGALEVEFENLTDTYAAFSADTPMALQLNFTGPIVGSGTDHSFLKLTIPQIFLEEGPPEVDGPKTLVQKCTFTGLDDATNPVVQFQYQSLDSAI